MTPVTPHNTQVPICTPIVISDGIIQSHGFYYHGRYYDYYRKIKQVTEWREMTNTERSELEQQVITSRNMDGRYNKNIQQEIFKI